NWQWSAGCGADAAPYFRIFNPTAQAQRYDPDGAYIRRWVPEIARLPTRCLFAPWTSGNAELRAAGVVLGKTYPRPIVDHAMARERALAALATLLVRNAPVAEQGRTRAAPGLTGRHGQHRRNRTSRVVP
ncbi:MAG: hypothetical protein JXP73_17965, partial [Deltaproteobacteria bacterium]|nr:hypothetical protein [Deltaproteobacteria bacterium]